MSFAESGADDVVTSLMILSLTISFSQKGSKYKRKMGLINPM